MNVIQIIRSQRNYKSLAEFDIVCDCGFTRHRGHGISESQRLSDATDAAQDHNRRVHQYQYFLRQVS